MAQGVPFRRAFAQVSKTMGPVSSHFTIRALTTAEARYGRFQKDLPERRAKVIKLISGGTRYMRAAAAVGLSEGTVARLWRERSASRGRQRSG